MRKYHHLNKIIDWRDFIPKIEPNIISFQLKDDNNFILAWGVDSEFKPKDFQFNKFQTFLDRNKLNYVFGFFSYDIKNKIEPTLSSQNKDYLNFPECYFFSAKNIIFKINGQFTYSGQLSLNEIYELIDRDNEKEACPILKVNLSPAISKEDYLNKLKKIKSYLHRGDIYEINFCQTYNASFKHLDPFRTFVNLKSKSDAPFSAYFTFEDFSILSISPERFVNKVKSKLISQPIKGTAARSENPKIDLKNIYNLKNSEKEIAENIMIVDLVRNDLSKIALKKSVKVEKLAELYSFKTVHQLISTISCNIDEELKETAIIKSLFPMGSMTGAPKYKAMEIAEELESFKRGIYSGAIGHFSPNGDFDFNVLIRTLLLNNKSNQLSVSVGGAITDKSKPEDEYNECLVKLKAIQDCLC